MQRGSCRGVHGEVAPQGLRMHTSCAYTTRTPCMSACGKSVHCCSYGSHHTITPCTRRAPTSIRAARLICRAATLHKDTHKNMHAHGSHAFYMHRRDRHWQHWCCFTEFHSRATVDTKKRKELGRTVALGASCKDGRLAQGFTRRPHAARCLLPGAAAALPGDGGGLLRGSGPPGCDPPIDAAAQRAGFGPLARFGPRRRHELDRCLRLQAVLNPGQALCDLVCLLLEAHGARHREPRIFALVHQAAHVRLPAGCGRRPKEKAPLATSDHPPRRAGSRLRARPNVPRWPSIQCLPSRSGSS